MEAVYASSVNRIIPECGIWLNPGSISVKFTVGRLICSGTLICEIRYST